MAAMQGTLWKWTNYLSGWQPRWFVLEGGALAYFLSPDEVHLGSRGSLKVSSCDILVHSSDHQRMDMVMPGGRHIYLRAASMPERQQWLLALGVAKQGGLEPDTSSGAKVPQVDDLHKKMENVQANCKLLVFKVESVRALTSDLSNIDQEAFSSVATDVNAACDDFLHTLEECMELSMSAHTQHLAASLKPLPLKDLYVPKGGGVSPVSKVSGFSESELYPPPPTPSSAPPQTPLARKTMPTSTEKATPTLTGKSLPAHLVNDNLASHLQSAGGIATPTDSGTDSKPLRSHSTSDLFVTPTSSPPPSRPARVGDRVAVESAESARRHETFFSSLPDKFECLKLEAKDGIPSQQFLQCCQAILPFFDTLSATAFAPVKADINGNIKKLSVKFQQDPVKYATLQGMVEAEVGGGTHQDSGSATDALLWLKRAMEFVKHFIAEVAGGEHSLDVAAGKAYSLSLRKYHSWIVRGVFNLAMKAVPYHKDFLQLLGSLMTDEGERQVTADMAVFAASLGEIVFILNRFYQEHNLNPLPPQ